ncbi:hypothetical protein HYN43_002550 [Mucilaginibacter celer]|uniref:Uncharacterized protein n=1 Tax=Mucilaginibacter celer TaxID=2305508 RepID=A0A494VMQ2_9SPHI|nr:hypothetical protein HYN43_002550 [Mucilaginibacter celer]
MKDTDDLKMQFTNIICNGGLTGLYLYRKRIFKLERVCSDPYKNSERYLQQVKVQPDLPGPGFLRFHHVLIFLFLFLEQGLRLTVYEE